MSPKFRKFLMYLPLFLSSLVAIGQEKGGPPPPNRTDAPPGLLLPIDDSIIYLLVVGLVLGVYFYAKFHKKQCA